MPRSIKDEVKEFELCNRLVAENLVDAVWVLNAYTMQYEYITPSVYRISGFTAEELLETSIIDRLTENSLVKCGQILKKKLHNYENGNQITQTLEVELVHKSGAPYRVEIKAKVFKNTDGGLKIIGVSRDISERKLIEKQLIDKNISLADALAEKD